MRPATLAFTFGLAGCVGARAPGYPSSRPPPLPPAPAPLDPSTVLLSFAPFTWQTAAGSTTDFPVLLSTDTGDVPRLPGRLIGHLRTGDRTVGAGARQALWCGWGPGRFHCDGDGAAAAEQARAHVLAVIDDLRAEAAWVGASEVGHIRCFVRARSDGAGGRMWCEGRGTTAQRDPRWSPPPASELVARAVIAPSRWRLAASFTAGRYGSRSVVGTTLDLTYRSVRTSFHMVSPVDQRSAGIGLDSIIRRRIGGQVSALGGVTAMLLTPLSSTGTVDNAEAAGAVGPVLGLALETEAFALFDGFGKPFVELRAGYLVARDGQELAGPNLELVLGLVTP